MPGRMAEDLSLTGDASLQRVPGSLQIAGIWRDFADLS
jgi:hypothetical protein